MRKFLIALLTREPERHPSIRLDLPSRGPTGEDAVCSPTTERPAASTPNYSGRVAKQASQKTGVVGARSRQRQS